jgi:hypothetical protein
MLPKKPTEFNTIKSSRDLICKVKIYTGRTSLVRNLYANLDGVHEGKAAAQSQNIALAIQRAGTVEERIAMLTAALVEEDCRCPVPPRIHDPFEQPSIELQPRFDHCCRFSNLVLEDSDGGRVLI